MLLSSWAEAGGDRREAALVSVFLLDLALSVSVLVWAGMRMDKYEIENWNREHDPRPQAKARRKKIDRICGAIMLVATILFLAVGFGWMALVNDYKNYLGWCRILSIVETLKRRKMNLMENIKQIFIGTPAIF